MKKTAQKQQEVTTRTQLYKSTYLVPTEFTATHRKSIYISSDHHEKISRIVFILSERKITLSDYMYNILKQHFDEFENEIKAIYKDKQKSIL
ncbi:hypothetical protein CMU32_12230 [Elizabethkingia anophelis]|nr:hypothetical protein [Elizabethkingia anophelis]